MSDQPAAETPATEPAKAPYEIAIIAAKDRFHHLSRGLVDYDVEELFALQLLTKNDYVFKVANANPRSVQLAMTNVASTGLTLNPALGYAYLVPRDGEICLDISYKGLIKIATDTGAIKWARADCVYEADSFVYHGPATMPDVTANPFAADRGEIVGAYVVAKTSEGDILTEAMSRADIEVIRGKSQAWIKGSAGKKGPWEDFFGEMCRKSVIKRAQKTWPRSTGPDDDRLALAVDLANKAEGGYLLEHEAPEVKERGTPMSGVWESLDPETRAWLLKVAAQLTMMDPDAAADKLVELQLGTEEYAGLWSRLASTTRTGITKANRRRAAAQRTLAPPTATPDATPEE